MSLDDGCRRRRVELRRAHRRTRLPSVIPGGRCHGAKIAMGRDGEGDERGLGKSSHHTPGGGVLVGLRENRTRRILLTQLMTNDASRFERLRFPRTISENATRPARFFDTTAPDRSTQQPLMPYPIARSLTIPDVAAFFAPFQLSRGAHSLSKLAHATSSGQGGNRYRQGVLSSDAPKGRTYGRQDPTPDGVITCCGSDGSGLFFVVTFHMLMETST